jgi:hypothetical protein
MREGEGKYQRLWARMAMSKDFTVGGRVVRKVSGSCWIQVIRDPSGPWVICPCACLRVYGLPVEKRRL